MPGEGPLHVTKRALAAELTGSHGEQGRHRPFDAPGVNVQKLLDEERIHQLSSCAMSQSSKIPNF